MSGILQGVVASIGGAITDAYFNLVTLLLPGNGTNGAQNNTFIDSSTNALSLTRIANTTQGTFSPFSQTGWSNYFDGTGDYLNTASNTWTQLSTGNFTVEGWAYINSYGTYFALVDARSSSGFSPWIFGVNSSGYADFFYGTTSGDRITDNVAVGLNTWVHLAAVRNGSTITLYVNGVSKATATYSSSINGGSSTPSIGRLVDPVSANGYISNLRVVIGTAVYTAAFTPPTAPLTAITNTSLLTCQSNRFFDNSANNFTITVNGNTSVQAFSPFNPTTSYDSAIVGGSGYFPDSDGGVTVPSNAVLNLGTGNFTLECWMYRPTSGTKYIFLANNFTNGLWAYTSSEKIVVGIGSADRITSTGGFQNNAWNHIAIARSGTTTTLYINGVANGSYTNTVTINQGILTVGNYSGSYSLFGYLANFRLVKGTAVYTGAFTPPTALLSTSGSASASAYPSTTNVNTSFAASETSVLLNFVNAGITDASAKNDLETVGNAQISTTQSKFGGSSMYFDGTGDCLISNAATTDLYAFGAGDFTIEFWVYFAVLPGAGGFSVLFDCRPSGTNGVYPQIYLDGSSNTLRWYVSSANRITGSTTISASTWYHVAVARSGTSTKMFLNGTQEGSTYTDSNAYLCGSQRPIIGADGTTPTTYLLNGYIDDLRVTKGYARYTANFTPPASAFPLD